MSPPRASRTPGDCRRCLHRPRRPRCGAAARAIATGELTSFATSLGDHVELARLRPPSGDLVDDSGVELAHSIPIPNGSGARRPSLALLGNQVFVAWLERPLDGSNGPGHLRIVRTSADGALLEDSGTSLPVDAVESDVTLYGASIGLIATWAEKGEAVGTTRILVVRLSPPLDAPEWTEIASPRLDLARPPQTISRGAAGKLLTIWSARPSGLSRVYGARIDCVP